MIHQNKLKIALEILYLLIKMNKSEYLPSYAIPLTRKKIEILWTDYNCLDDCL